jgi:hypothetical protein
MRAHIIRDPGQEATSPGGDARGAAGTVGGDSIKPVFIGGTDEGTTSVVQRLLAAHPACVPVPRLTFLSERGGLADLVAGATRLDRFLSAIRNDWYPSSPGLQGLCPPERFEEVVDRFGREWSVHNQKPARRLVRGLLGKGLSRSPHVYWVEASPANVRVGPILPRIMRGARMVIAVPTVSSPMPVAHHGGGYHVRLDALLDPECQGEYLALVKFLDIADHGQMRQAVQAEIRPPGSASGPPALKRRFWRRGDAVLDSPSVR